MTHLHDSLSWSADVDPDQSVPVANTYEGHRLEEEMRRSATLTTKTLQTIKETL